MPIRPENRGRYPKNWPEIVASVRTRSGGQCECTGQCGWRHVVIQEADGQVDLPPALWLPSHPGERCRAKHGELHPVTEGLVVLTVMHLDHQPENNDPANLLHGCQRCHNRYDAPHRRSGIRARAAAASGQGELL